MSDHETDTAPEPSGRQQATRSEIRERESKAENLAQPSVPTVYEVISQAGVEEMKRPVKSLWWSGVAAGLAISLSLYVMGALRMNLGDTGGGAAIEKLGYCIGFLVVMLSRLQLFTENTIKPILPALNNPSWHSLWCVARIWGIVFVANLVGTFVAATLLIIVPIANAEHIAAMLDISRHAASMSESETFLKAIPAGFMIAALVWMMPASKGFEFWTIVAMTYAIAIAETSHVIVGSTEYFSLALDGQASFAEVATRIFLTGLGNIVGGTGLFAILAYAQVSEEL